MPSKCLVAVTLFVTPLLPAQAFVNYESGPVRPVRISPDASRLFVTDTVGGHLCVFDLGNPSSPVLIAEIAVGLDPVAVNVRTRDEVWVCNLMSDSVSIVDVARRCVVDTIRVKDEPSDVVFAGGKAFVSTATSDAVKVFDVTTRAALGTVALFGKDPRGLATSPDGSRVYAVIQRSGNGTTVLPVGIAPPPPLPTNPALPAAPPQALIVRADDPNWSASIPYTLPDNDVAEIDVGTLAVTRYFRTIGTTNTGIAVHPTTGDLWVANTEARNLVRFEPDLRGHAIDSRLTRVSTGVVPSIARFDLNPGIDYSLLPNAAARSTALAEPFGVAIDATAGLVYTAAHGTDRIGVVDLAGQVVARIEVGGTSGAAVNTRAKRGPRGLALHPTQSLLYVHNHLSDTLAVIDTASRTVLRELRIGTWDPMPAAIRAGRKFLYDARLSGNGTMSCAACHVDADTDGIGWDLGDPTGSMQDAPSQPSPFHIGITQFHPMKGPMTTQTLRGLSNTEPLHWRGDRADFAAFNPAFVSLMGGTQLAAVDIAEFAAFATSIAMPGNPNQSLDRSLRTSPPGNNEAAGLAAMQANVATLPVISNASCVTCHTLPTGTNRRIIANVVLNRPQQVKVPQLRNLYRKVGFNRVAGPQKAGFGYLKDGTVDNLTSFVNIPQFNDWPSATKDDIVTFLLSFDTGTAPALGLQLTLSQGNSNSAATVADVALLTVRAAAGDLDLTAHGLLDGRPAGLLYSPVTGLFTVDRTGEGPFTATQLRSKAHHGTALLTLTAVPPGSGNRLALDRDLDGTMDGDEAPSSYGLATSICPDEPRLLWNSEPRVGNLLFALTMDDAPTDAVGVLMTSLGQSSLPLAGMQLLVDPNTGLSHFLFSDAWGGAVMPLPLPPGLGYVGQSTFAQVGWVDACGPQGLTATRGLHFTTRP